MNNGDIVYFHSYTIFSYILWDGVNIWSGACKEIIVK